MSPRRDRRDERGGLRHYAFLRARAPEGSTAKCVTLVMVVTGNFACLGGKRPDNASGEVQPAGVGNGECQSLKNQAGCRWRSSA